MAQQPIEMILAKQLAGYLAMPIFLVDPEGNLVFYNEPAESILGHRFEETGVMPLEEWATEFTPTDADGQALAPADLPLSVALQKEMAAHRGMTITGLDGVTRNIEVTALPLKGEYDRMLGAIAFFWEA